MKKHDSTRTNPDQVRTDSAPDSGSDSASDSDGRRISALVEIRDGGYGVGSAAPLEDGAMPFGHPVKAWEDTKTRVLPEGAGYADVDPDVWFTDANAAESAGFHAGS